MLMINDRNWGKKKNNIYFYLTMISCAKYVFILVYLMYLFQYTIFNNVLVTLDHTYCVPQKQPRRNRRRVKLAVGQRKYLN